LYRHVRKEQLLSTFEYTYYMYSSLNLGYLLLMDIN